jgi:hypothetical protein
MGVLSAITRLPLCNPAFSQLARDRQGRSNALFERVSEGAVEVGSKSSRGSSPHSHRHSLLTKNMPLTCTDPPLAQPTPHANPTSSITSAQPACRPLTNALAITDASHRLALLSTQPFPRTAVRRGAAGRRRSDPAAAWQCSRQFRVLAGGLTAEPSWLPNAACAAATATRFAVTARRGDHRCPPCLGRPVRVLRQRPRVQRPPVQCPASGTCRAAARPVSGVRVRCPCPVSVSGVRCPCPVSVSGVRCPCPVSGVRVRCPASVSTLSAPVSSWSAWMRQAATRLGTGRVG